MNEELDDDYRASDEDIAKYRSGNLPNPVVRSVEIVDFVEDEFKYAVDPDMLQRESPVKRNAFRVAR